MAKFFETFYGILFHPVETFRNFDCAKSYKMPLAVVLLMSLFLFIIKNSIFIFSFGTLFEYIFNAIGLIIMWLFFAFFVDMLAKIFNIESGYNRLLTLTAFGLVPWIFLAPVKLLKGLGQTTSDIASILLVGIWIWTIVLQILAVSETYKIPRENAIILMFIPFTGFILYICWTWDFFAKLIQFSNL